MLHTCHWFNKIHILFQGKTELTKTAHQHNLEEPVNHTKQLFGTNKPVLPTYTVLNAKSPIGAHGSEWVKDVFFVRNIYSFF